MIQGPADDLEQLLGAWAASQRLGEVEVGEIRSRIVDAPALDFAWWDRLTTQVCAAVRVAGTPIPPLSPKGAPPKVAWSAA